MKTQYNANTDTISDEDDIDDKDNFEQQHAILSDDDDSIFDEATLILVAESKLRFAAADSDSKDDIRSLNSFVVFDDPRKMNPGNKQEDIVKEARKNMKDRKEMYNALKDYGLFSKLTLEEEVKGKMLCRCCVADYLSADAKHNKKEKIDVKDFGLHVSSQTSTFVTILRVECRSGRHSFLIEPPRRKQQEESETSNSKPPKKK